jgi:hypothetical protein
MAEDSASLQNLHDIVIPAPPPLWPPAPGVWVLLVIVLAVVIALGVWWWSLRSRNTYRRAGLALLVSARTSREVNIILKRVALAVWPRPEVAPLYGQQWAVFLDRTCRGSRFAELPDADGEAEATNDLRRQARAWIRKHRAPDRTGGGGG